MRGKRARPGGKRRRAQSRVKDAAPRSDGGAFVPPPESPWRGLPFGRFLLYFGGALALHALQLGVLHRLPLRDEGILTLLNHGWMPHAALLGVMLATYFAGRHARLVVFLAGTGVSVALMRPAVAGAFGFACLVTWLISRWRGHVFLRLLLALATAVAVPIAWGVLGQAVATMLRPRPSVELGLWIIFLFRCLLYQMEHRRLDDSHRSFISYLGSFTVLPMAGTALVPPMPYRAFLGRYGANDPERNLRAGLGLFALGLLYQVLWNGAGPYVLDPIASVGAATRVEGFEAALAAASRWKLASALALLPTFKYLALAAPLFLAVGNLRLLGFDLESGFRYHYISHNFAELWRRYNHYYRDSLMVLFYDPALARLRRRTHVAAAMGLAVMVAFVGQALVRQVFGSLTLLPPQAWVTAWGSGQHVVPVISNATIGVLTAITVLWLVVRRRRGEASWGRRVPAILGVLAVSHVMVLVAHAAQKGLSARQLLAIVRFVFGLG